MDIVNNRTNANKLLARLLFDLREKVSFAYFIWKGNKDNVIPREAFAELVIEAECISNLVKRLMR